MYIIKIEFYLFGWMLGSSSVVSDGLSNHGVSSPLLRSNLSHEIGPGSIFFCDASCRSHDSTNYEEIAPRRQDSHLSFRPSSRLLHLAKLSIAPRYGSSPEEHGLGCHLGFCSSRSSWRLSSVSCPHELHPTILPSACLYRLRRPLSQHPAKKLQSMSHARLLEQGLQQQLLAA